VLIANPAESKMNFDGFVQVINNSGEDYENAQVRLVVGVVNLVEKIRNLALPPVHEDKEYARSQKREELKKAIAVGEMNGDRLERAPEIVKEGLSEYFIYTIEGEQTVPNGWSKRLSSFKARQVPFDVLYRLRPHQYGERPVRFFMLKNDAEHKLGTTPLPDGMVRTFRDNGKDGLSFLGQQSTKYIPIKADIELNVGTDDEVVEKHQLMKAERSNFTFDYNPRPPRVIGWDERRSWKDEIRNHSDKPIRMEIRYVFPGDIDFASETAKLFDYQTVQFTFDVAAGDKLSWDYSFIQHMGSNTKQNRIQLVDTLR
jgi:hypothetical protein